MVPVCAGFGNERVEVQIGAAAWDANLELMVAAGRNVRWWQKERVTE